MDKIILCISIFLNIIGILVIVKQNSVIQEQTSLLKETAPVIDRVYNERIEFPIKKKENKIIEVKSCFVSGTRECQIQYPTEEIINRLYIGLINEIRKNDAVSVKCTSIGNGEIQHEATLFIVARGDNE